MYPIPTTFHIEPTTVCNAACPMCPRNDRGGPMVGKLPLVHLPLSVFKPILETTPGCVYFCGNYGEPAMYRDLKKAIALLRVQDMHIGVNTNGGVHPASWWADLAKLMGKNAHATFSLDGLEDTHHLYRRKTSYEIVERNMRAFIDAGGEAEWHFLVFKHNEHQVDEARARANKFGAKFTIKRTSRFVDIRGRLSPTYNIIDGTKLELPTNPEYVNKEVLELSAEDSEKYLNTTNIVCKTLKERSVYVGADALMLPCCWTGQLVDPKQHGNERIAELIALHGRSTLSLVIHSVKDIVGGDIFRSIEAGWDKPLSCGRSASCAINCGAHDKFANQMRG